jgi:hypothetical protein
MGRVNQRIGFARQGNEKYRKSLQNLGISLEDVDKGLVGTEETFLAMINHLHEMDDAQKQAALAGDFFGVMLSRRMMPLIKDGVQSVEELRERAHELGLVMDDLAIAKGDLLADTLDDLSFTAKGLGRIFGSEMHAPMINIANAITDVISGISTWLTENPKVVRQIIVWGGAIAGVLGVLVTLGTTLVITGKIIGALGAIFNILTSKPMLIIAAIGALYLAWENDWLGIRTAVEDAWERIEPILTTLWEWLGRAWNWAINIAGDAWEWIENLDWAGAIETIKGWLTAGWNWLVNIAGNAWEWLTQTTWAEKIEDIKGWLTAGWEWLVNVAGSAWVWLAETTWADKIEDIRNWLSNAWSWVLDLGGTAWAWIDENLPWLADAIEWLWDKISAAWQWTITKAGDAWDWFKDSALVQWLDDLKQKITDSKAWKWTIDVALPTILEGGEAVIKAVVEAGGAVYDAIKKGLDTGDWSDFWDIASDIWNAGVAIALSLQLVSGAASWILTAIGSIFGNSAGKLGIGGIPLAIGLLTVGIQLLEAQAEGSYEAFVRNVLVAALVGAIGGAVFGPGGALIGFNLTLSLKLGEIVEEGIYSVVESMGLPRSHLQMLEEYEQYRQALIDEATKDMNWIQKWWWQFTGNQPEGLLSFPEWKKAMGYVTEELESVTESVEETIEAIEELDEVLNTTSGFDPLLDAIYRAEGGAQARVPYGMTGFADAGNKFSNERNQALFEELAKGLEEGSEEYYRAAVSVSVQHYWRTFEEKFPEVAGKTFEELDPTMQQLFVLHMGRWFSPPSAHELNKKWVPNVLSILGHEDAAAEFRAGSQELLNAWIEGVYDMASDAEAAAAYIAGIFADYLVGQSPPPEGPLSDIDEGGVRVADAWVEGMVEGVEESTPLLTRALDHIKTLLSSVWEKVPEDIRLPIENAIQQAENALFRLDELYDELQNAITGGNAPEEQATSFMGRLAKALDDKLEVLDDPLNRFVDMVSSAALHLGEVVKAVSSGDWVGAILSIIMETESFAKAMELIGKVLAPVVALFDNVLRPIIEGLLKLWNGIIDALVSISIFGWKPFAGLKSARIEWDDPDSGSGGSDRSSTSGRQISEITGPTRDLLVDLLSPLANFGQIVAPIQDIRNILYERLPNFNAFETDFAAAGAGAMGTSITIENITVQSLSKDGRGLARDLVDDLERELARRINFGVRGRGGRW